MIVGVPKEIKTDEYRVSMTPAGAHELVKRGHKVFLEDKHNIFLKNWHQFEVDNPDIFERMYPFWVRKIL